jgi:hypothetical protein
MHQSKAPKNEAGMSGLGYAHSVQFTRHAFIMVPGESNRPVRSLYTDLVVMQYDDACPLSYHLYQSGTAQ